jgi:DNA-binding NarL/FixJ family response regulator
LIRVAVEARSEIDRAGLVSVLRNVGFEIVSDVSEADVLLVADELDETGTDSPPVVLITNESPPLAEALDSGVRSVLPRDAPAAEIEAAIRAVAAGLVALRPEELQARSTPPATEVGSTLTPREVEVLRMIAEGLPNKTIAWRLGISEHTVKYHVTSILNRLGASSRAEAVAIGIRRGLVLL